MISINNTSDYQIDVFLKVTNDENNNKNAYDIINDHIQITKNNPMGYTWWGNNQNYSPEKIRDFKMAGHSPKVLFVIPHTSSGSDNIEYIADILDSVRDNNKTLLNDKWRPDYYFNTPHKVWLKLANFYKVNVIKDGIDISDYFLLASDDQLLSKMKSQYACGYVYRLKNNTTEYDDVFQNLVNNVTASRTAVKPQPKPKSRRTGIGEAWDRDPQKAKEAIEIANYKCEINSNHTTFMSSRTKKNFVEAHHLIPMKEQGSFNHSIDVPANIISLCPNCHRAIHLADNSLKEALIRTLYTNRINQLIEFGINITIDDLLDRNK